MRIFVSYTQAKDNTANKFIILYMKSILLIIFLFSYNILFSQIDDKIIEIGKNASELLIQRKSIENSKYALKIKKLFPKEDFEKFKDSPAEFILASLHDAELELPITWNELKFQAEKLKMGENAEYQTTYFRKMSVDNYTIACIIKSQSNYFIFNFNVLEWEKDIYISRFYKEIRKYNTLQEAESNLSSIIENEINKEIKDMEDYSEEGELVSPQSE